MCSVHEKVRKSPSYTDINRQNVRALISVSSFVYISQKSSVTADAHCRQSQKTNIFPLAPRGRNFFSKTRAAFDITLECGDNPFLPNDCKYRRICGIVGQIELQRTCRSWQPFHRKRDAGTRVYVHARAAIAIDEFTRHRSPFNTTEIGLQRASSFLRVPFSTLLPFSITEPTPFKIQSVCMSFL